ncbi:glyoxalase [Microbacterium hydrocarbonoxydans]|uniref:glyoxalase n=1 Tax=Microbacterium hydrocarbonoxydans TaxID=273678 RepID=UPI0013DB083F|nr:glyoxalase [Microbacterium hydrocarbonoxydans]
MNNTIDSFTLDVTDVAAAQTFYETAFGLSERLRFRLADAGTSGFRGYTLSLVASQPGNVRALFDAAVTAGATVVKPVSKSLWGVGGVVQAPDGALWNIATSAKKDTAPVAKAFDHVVLLLGVDDVRASRAFYADRGFRVRKSFGSYVDFETPAGSIGLGLYKRAALAKSAGVSPDGSGSHRITVHGAIGAVVDADGFAWEPVTAAANT